MIKNNINTIGKGSRVQFVNALFPELSEILKIVLNLPVFMEEYTVRAVDMVNDALWLEELRNELLIFPDGRLAEPSFKMSRFRILGHPNCTIKDYADENVFPEAWLTGRLAEDQDISIWFSKLRDQEKLSLFHKRINSDEETPYDEMLRIWWMNRY